MKQETSDKVLCNICGVEAIADESKCFRCGEDLVRADQSSVSVEVTAPDAAKGEA